jgi:hypothetical protein
VVLSHDVHTTSREVVSAQVDQLGLSVAWIVSPFNVAVITAPAGLKMEASVCPVVCPRITVRFATVTLAVSDEVSWTTVSLVTG